MGFAGGSIAKLHSGWAGKIGGGSARCVVDEAAVGKVGVRVGKPASRLGSMLRGPARIARREPCKTVWKRGARKGDAAKAKKSKESEVARFKLWPRSKWSKLRSTNSKCTAKKQAKLENKVAEYVLQTNLSQDMRLAMSVVLEALRVQAKCKAEAAVNLP